MRQPYQSVTKFVKQSKKTILLIAVAVLATLLFSALVSMWLDKTVDLYIPSFATMRTLGVKAYWDLDLKNATTELPWSTVYPGTSNNVTLYLQSVSNIRTKLELQTANWTLRNSDDTIVLGPVGSTNYMNLTWDYNNATIDPGQVVHVTLTLSTDKSDDFVWFIVNNDVKEFSFDIKISTSEYG